MGGSENNGLQKAAFEPSQLDLLAASLRLNNSDIQGSLKALGEFLQSLSPSAVTMKTRKKGLRSKEAAIEEISFRMGDQIFMVTSGKAGGPVKFSRSKIVRDIVIKTDELTMEKWAASLAQHMATEAENSEATRSALNRILGLG